MAGTILVADDSATIQKVIKIAFSSFPIKMLEASSYSDALRNVQLHQPDILIADANLIGISRPEDFVELQEKAGGIPVLLLSGSYENIDESAFEALGFQHFLKKPFDALDIVSYIKDRFNYDLEAIEPPEEHEIPAPPPPPKGIPQEAIVDVGAISAPPGSLAGIVTTPAPAELTETSEDDSQSPMTDLNARGKRAFDGYSTESTDISPIPAHEEQAIAPFEAGPAPTLTREEILEMVTPILKEEIEGMVEKVVINFCKENFNELAREILLQELRRLAEERSQHLVDS